MGSDTEMSASGAGESPPIGGAYLSRRSRNRLFVLTALVCGGGFAVISLFPRALYAIVPPGDYLVYHTAVEFLSAIVSFAVFVVGWYGYRQNGNRQDLTIGVVFGMVGALTFLHTLSYKDMPAFLSPNTVSKASTFWIATRLVEATGLLAAAFVAAASRRWWLSPRALGVSALLLLMGITVVVSYFPRLLPPMYLEGVGQTPLKKHLEWLVIALYAGSIYAYGRRRRRGEMIMLQLGLLVGIFSELGFTLYESAFDTYNLLGHSYRLVAYYMIFRALFVSSFERPYYELIKARDQIEESFSRIGAALASGLELKDTLQLIADLGSDMLGSNYAAVMLLRDGQLQIEAQRGIPQHPARVPLEHTIAGQAVATRRPVAVADVTRVAEHDPDCHCQHLDGAAAKSAVAAPIMSDAGVLGVLEVYSPEVGAFGPEEAELLSTFARQAAVAIRNSLAYERERMVAETLQRSLLRPPPDIPGLEIAVRYVPAEEAARVGGDLYDVFALDDEHVVLVIGDVSGHGLQAASITAMTTYMIRGFLTQGMSPGKALELTNVALCRHGAQPNFVTVFLAVLDTRARKLAYANAGHHMPMIVSPGACRSLELHPGLPLAVDEIAEYDTVSADLADASGMLLYTDGVVEARRHGEFFGDQRLSGVCTQMVDEHPEQLLDSIVDGVRALSGILQDDIAVLAIRWAGRPAPAQD